MGDLNCNMLPSSLNNVNTQALLSITDIYNIINNYWMRLSMLAIIIKAKVCVIC